MPPLALAFVLASAVVHAGWNAILKRQPDPEAAAAVLVLGAALISAVLGAACGQLVPPLVSLPWIFASSFIEAAYFVALSRALARLPLGTAYGLSRGGGQLVTWPIAVLALGEHATGLTVLGAAVLLTGLVARVEWPIDRRGFAWAGACALAIGLYPLTYKQALDAGAPKFGLFALSLAGALPLQILVLGGPKRLIAATEGKRILLVIASALCAASFLAFLAALALAGAGRISALRNISIVFATLLGWAQGEKRDARAIFGAAAITIGAVAISWD